MFNNFEGFKGSTQVIYFGMAVKYHIQVDMVDIFGKLWFWELDARVELILSTGEGQQKTGSDQLREQYRS